MASWLPDAEKVASLHSIRVLLVSRDHSFLGLATLLLGRRGFQVERASKPARVDETVDRFAAQVVVVDGSESFRKAVARARDLRARYPGIGLVVTVDEGPLESVRGIEVVEKWSSAESLVEAVMRSRWTAELHGSGSRR